MPVPRSRAITLRIDGPEWEPLFAYADSQGITATTAARELLMTSMATYALDAVYAATARTTRHTITKIAYAASARALKAAWQETIAKCAELGIPLEDL